MKENSIFRRLFIVLYVAVIRLYAKGQIKSVFLGLAAPILGTVGSLIIFSGSVVSVSFAIYAAICLLFILAAYLFFRGNRKNIVIKSDAEYEAEEAVANAAAAKD